MKRTLLALTLAGTLGFGTIALHAQATDAAEQGPGHRHGRGEGHGGGRGAWGDPLGHLTKELNLTSDQQAKVGPIVDQAKPQIVAIHQEAMQKTKTVMDTAAAQIRPLLTPEQQTKFDAIRKAREDMRNARIEMRKAHRAKVNG